MIQPIEALRQLSVELGPGLKDVEVFLGHRVWLSLVNDADMASSRIEVDRVPFPVESVGVHISPLVRKYRCSVRAERASKHSTIHTTRSLTQPFGCFLAASTNQKVVRDDRSSGARTPSGRIQSLFFHVIKTRRSSWTLRGPRELR
jgi:hypothetical protein